MSETSFTGRSGDILPTLCGVLAIALWSTLALLTAASGAVPPFQLTAICFAIASVIGLIVILRRGAGLSIFRHPLSVWLVGVGGLFGYHALYFTALRNAPPVEAGLIAYLWPMLIILFSALLPGERLRWYHVAGGLVSLFGALLLLGFPQGFSADPAFVVGYLAATACALTWSSYSVLSRRFADVPSLIVTGFCAVACLLAIAAHLALEVTHWPTTTGQWGAVILLGLGPVGLAFFFWDHAMKRGRIQLLGTLSYAAPVLSTLLLIAAGFGEPTWRVAAAALLVTSGSLLAALGRDNS